MIEQCVKGDLFHKLKFISSQEMMMYSQNPRLLCHLFCTKFNVQGTNQGIFWSTYSKVIIKVLSKKRLDVTNAMKQAFKGNIFELLYLYIHLLTFHEDLYIQDKKEDSSSTDFFMPKDIVDTRCQTNECYFDFANFFISPIAGKRKFETRC